MTYIPHTASERQEMLEAIGAPSLEALFADVPQGVRFPGLALPPALSEMEIQRDARRLAAVNSQVEPEACFVGAGAYNHFIPATVDEVLRRGELYTSYTPYQPEMSQDVVVGFFQDRDLQSHDFSAIKEMLFELAAIQILFHLAYSIQDFKRPGSFQQPGQ